MFYYNTLINIQNITRKCLKLTKKTDEIHRFLNEFFNKINGFRWFFNELLLKKINGL